MNCIILLFLLGCCGSWGNGRNSCCTNICRRNDECGCCGNGNVRGGNRQNCGRTGNCGCGEEHHHRDGDCGCMEEHHHHHNEDCGCAQNERESCDVPGMIPPPWQEYPGFPHRDNRENCES